MLEASMDLWLLGKPKKKERTVKGDQCDLAKDPPIVKSVFSPGHQEGK